MAPDNTVQYALGKIGKDEVSSSNLDNSSKKPRKHIVFAVFFCPVLPNVKWGQVGF
jgi:hypothetical protein